VSLYAVSALIIAAIATIVPAEGAHLYFHPSHEQFSNFTNHSGMWHYHLLVKLRTTHVLYFDPFHLQGMVTFPSFHAAAAVLTAYAVRGVQFIRIPVLAFSLLMIVSAVPEGGHYLVDVIAGVLIAVACIVVRAYFSQSSMGLVADQI
jgi:membrane-associated phospholipid phosphatase